MITIPAVVLHERKQNADKTQACRRRLLCAACGAGGERDTAASQNEQGGKAHVLVRGRTPTAFCTAGFLQFLISQQHLTWTLRDLGLILAHNVQWGGSRQLPA